MFWIDDLDMIAFGLLDAFDGCEKGFGLAGLPGFGIVPHRDGQRSIVFSGDQNIRVVVVETHGA